MTYHAVTKEYAEHKFNEVCNKYITEYNMDIYTYTKTENKFAIYDKFGYEIMKVIVDTYENHYKNWNW